MHRKGGLLAFFRRFEYEAGRLRGREGLFEQFHILQLFHARLRALRRRRAHDVAGNVVFERRNFLLLFFVFFEVVLVLFGFENLVFGVISAECGNFSVFQFQRFGYDGVEEIAVVRYGEDRAAVVFEVIFQPEQGIYVEVVGRLVQKEYFGLFEQKAAQLQARLFAAAHGGNNLLVHRRKAHAVEHRFDAHVDVVPVRRVDGAGELFVAGGELPVFLAAVFGVRHAALDFALFVHGAQYGAEHRAHLVVNRPVALQAAVLFEDAEL